MAKNVVVFVSASSFAEARKIAHGVVASKLAACVSVIPSVESIYWWKGKIETGRELILVMKTTKPRVPALVRRVKLLHSYEVPEIIALPIDAGNPDYLRWIGESVKGR